MLTWIPALPALAAVRFARWRSRKGIGDWVPVVVIGVIFGGAAVTVWWIVLDRLPVAPGIDTGVLVRMAVAVYLATIYFGAIVAALLRKDDGWLPGAVVISTLPVALVVVAVVFGALVYPAIHPALGGGASWEGRVYIGTADEVSDVNAIVVDRSSGLLSIVRCGSDPEGGLVKAEVPVGRVVETKLHRLVDPRRALPRWEERCRDEAVPKESPSPVPSDDDPDRLGWGAFTPGTDRPG